MYLFTASGAGPHRILGSGLGGGLGLRRPHICILLIAEPAGTRRSGDNVALTLYSRWGGSWENRTYMDFTLLNLLPLYILDVLNVLAAIVELVFNVCMLHILFIR